MRTHTSQFKNTIKQLGRQLKGIITYDNVELEDEVYSITPHYEGAILKSVMKQLDIELSVDIPIGTILNCQIGIFVGNDYEMLNFGNYVVYDSKKQEDKNTYLITCYDKLIYSMKQNEDMNITYPISIKNYLSAVASKIGLSLATTIFNNSELQIAGELYVGLDYTYRDILDEIAQVAGGIICLNNNDQIVVKYPTQTSDTIDESFLKDVNVDFGQKYGPINSIVLSRSGESDNVYLQDEDSVEENGLTEVKIVDNQIMNFNDRSDYLEGILSALDGLYYYINDFTSTGILYYEVGDIYNVQVDNKTYQCLMLNDEIEVTTGIKEQVYAEMPKENETDYTKADKTDRRINQTYLIVDKQNQSIEAVITTQTEQNQQISRVVQTVDELNSKISDLADVTTSLESNSARLEFEKINESEPVRIVIHPNGTNITKLYPSPILYPSTSLYFKVRILRFENTTDETIVDYELPDDLLYYNSENYDEFILDYDAHTCIVNKKCKWNNDGTVGLLETPRTDNYEYPTIELTNGDYTISLLKYQNAYLFARLMVQNIYTTQFATRAEVGSQISQTTQDINLSVDTKLSNYSTTTQMNSAINLKATEITSSVSENYATKETLNNNYSTTEQTANMISTTVSQMTKNNLEEVTVEYALGTSTTTAPTSGWSTTAPTWQQGKYMWQRTKTTTADGTEQTSDPTCIAGAKGQDGTNGVSVSSITEYYAVSSSNSSAPADNSFSTNIQTMTSTNKYLWNYELITYSNNTTSKTSKRVIGVYGDKGQDGTNGTNGVGISNIVNKYAVSSSNTTAPSSWSNTPQTMTATNKYLWNYEIITYSNNTTYTSTPAVIGTYGEKGNTGDTGKGVREVVAQYYLSTSNTSQTGGSWTETQPAYQEGYYYWTRTKITWTDNTTTYTTPILVEEINSLNQSVASLNVRAGSIESTVSTKVGNNEVISKINQSAEAVTINANKFNINGVISANGNFKVDTAGNMEATSATLTNALIKSNSNDSSITLDNGNIMTKDDDGNKGVELIRQNINFYSYNDADNYIGTLGSIVTDDNFQLIELYADSGAGIYFGVKNNNDRIDTFVAINYQNSGMVAFPRVIKAENNIRIEYGNAIQFRDDGSVVREIYLSTAKKIIVEDMYSKAPVFGFELTGNHYEGTPVISTRSPHVIFIEWNNQLNFYVDATYVGTLSDRRLKKDITELDNNLVRAIAECEVYQFRADNKKDVISAGIMAQDFQEKCKKYGIKAEDYGVFKKIKYNLNDNTEYYAIDYEQYLIIKNKYLEDKLKEQDERINRLEGIINELYKNNVE